MNDISSTAAQAVLQCQQQFWHALQRQDAALFVEVLAEDFVCCSLGQADQGRAAFIATITSLPLVIESIAGEAIAIRLLNDIAVLTGTQVAHLRLPNGDILTERLVLTNIFQQTAGRWRIILAHPVLLPS